MTGGPRSGEVAWVGGSLQPRAAAAVPVDDFAVRFGAAAFETMLARNGRVFRLAAHLDRLEAGLRLMGVEPLERATLTRAVEETLAANGLRDASVRLSVSAGSGRAPDLRAASQPLVVVTVDSLGAGRPRSRLAVSSVRIDARRPWRAAKVAQFLPYLLAREEAQAAGAEDALLLDHDGHVVEAATANLFLVVEGRLVTPSLECGPLPGVTRGAVIEVARGLGVTVVEAAVTLDEVAHASAAFATSSVAGVQAITSIVGEPPASPEAVRLTFPEAPPPLLARVREAYEALVAEECGTGLA